MYDLAVIVARMQPMHLEHENLINTALSKAQRVLLLLGSEGAAPSLRNPFEIHQRRSMVEIVFGDYMRQGRLIVEGVRDMSYQPQLWLNEVRYKVHSHRNKYGSTSVLMLRGGREDSDHIQADFPIYDHEVYPVTQKISGTEVREDLYEGVVSDKVSAGISLYLMDQFGSEALEALSEEHYAAKAYRKSWAGSPFPPMFLAADNVVAWHRTSVSKPRILLIERKSEFGNGRWALPGGYVEQDQTLEQAARAELVQEAGLDLDQDFPAPVMFDAINRSARGRMVTAVFHNKIQSDTEPKVIGGDDAARAFWIPLMELRLYERNMFSDHYHILGKLYPEIYHV